MTYGEEAAERAIKDHAEVSVAALAGNLEALKALVAVAAGSGYVDGYSAASKTAGFPL